MALESYDERDFFGDDLNLLNPDGDGLECEISLGEVSEESTNYMSQLDPLDRIIQREIYEILYEKLAQLKIEHAGLIIALLYGISGIESKFQNIDFPEDGKPITRKKIAEILSITPQKVTEIHNKGLIALGGDRYLTGLREGKQSTSNWRWGIELGDRGISYQDFQEYMRKK